jgi:hypothetical protein
MRKDTNNDVSSRVKRKKSSSVVRSFFFFWIERGRERQICAAFLAVQ